ncbi:MAG: SulP family inorganic anion transporter [Actinobacteria bacterium]|nr:SulP family inorganic anion transporter [Actinomycetota bacterium]
MEEPTPLTFPPARAGGADLLAGISVALVLIPQSMAYAELAGLPPHVGLFASTLPLIAAALYASSPYLQTGPVAMTSLLTLGALTGLAQPESADYVALAALLALVVGVTRLLLGVLRLGLVTYLMTDPVVTGFKSAAAILIMCSQLPKALGVSAPDGGVLWRAGWSLVHPDGWEFQAILLAAVTLALLLRGRRIHRFFPGALIAVAGGIIYAGATGYEGTVVGQVPTGLPTIAFDLQWDQLGSVVASGVVIALVGFAEAASISRVFATEDRQTWSADREFISQGLANVAAAFAGGFPVGGSFSRSSLNRLAGARTRWSGLVTGLVVLAFLPFADLVEQLPRAVLGGVVIAAVLGLVQPRKLIGLARQSTGDGVVTLGTFAATLVLAPHVDRAVLVGIVLALAVRARRRRVAAERRDQLK